MREESIKCRESSAATCARGSIGRPDASSSQTCKADEVQNVGSDGVQVCVYVLHACRCSHIGRMCKDSGISTDHLGPIQIGRGALEKRECRKTSADSLRV
jgi:hypothetical protein